jgi:hypothetical protein
MAPAMSKVINMFRARSSSSATADDKRRIMAKVGTIWQTAKGTGRLPNGQTDRQADRHTDRRTGGILWRRRKCWGRLHGSGHE